VREDGEEKGDGEGGGEKEGLIRHVHNLLLKETTHRHMRHGVDIVDGNVIKSEDEK